MGAVASVEGVEEEVACYFERAVHVYLCQRSPSVLNLCFLGYIGCSPTNVCPQLNCLEHDSEVRMMIYFVGG